VVVAVKVLECRHQSESVARRDETVVRREVLETTLNDTDARQTGKAQAKRIARGGVGMDKPKTIEHPNPPL
jgi:hypothetical protein